MTLYEELQARGLIAQVTDEKLIPDLINNGKATFYIGFDPTADSLHVGHFMALILMKRLQMGGNKPIALVGGGTGMIGDPSGRTDMRSMMTTDIIDHNCECFKKQMSRFIEFGDGDGQAIMVNNADWLRDLNFLEFMRDIGSQFYRHLFKTFNRKISVQRRNEHCRNNGHQPISKHIKEIRDRQWCQKHKRIVFLIDRSF
ncbi:MAG: tyrosine--tRNA ligase [Paludibacteraceae bacterium]|nr:tyrosine--tRNA ligase [Paludibacteraceae bacterium]